MMTAKENIQRIIFESDTPSGKLFDVILFWCIILSSLVTIIESIADLPFFIQTMLSILEWTFTIAFSIEYLTRLVVAKQAKKYATSIWGVIDLLAVLPAYISLIVGGFHYLIVIRILRLLRVFRVLRLVRFYSESLTLIKALKSGATKISVFLLVVVMIVLILGTIMYVVEGPGNGFTSIPLSIYWAIITITTVGYGDVVPLTALGKFISSITMLLGYSIIAVPTGIVTAELAQYNKNKEVCKTCSTPLEFGAKYCSNCGVRIGTQNLDFRSKEGI
jgi:voltage-gated potassium channel